MEHDFTIARADAIVGRLTISMSHCRDPAQKCFTHLEDMSFTYRKITKTHQIASTSESDGWHAMSIQV